MAKAMTIATGNEASCPTFVQKRPNELLSAEEPNASSSSANGRATAAAKRSEANSRAIGHWSPMIGTGSGASPTSKLSWSVASFTSSGFYNRHCSPDPVFVWVWESCTCATTARCDLLLHSDSGPDRHFGYVIP